MPKTIHATQVGAPDPEHRTSPIYAREEADDLSADFELETGFCYFNDTRYRMGDYVRSGEELLRCEERGIWVRHGEGRY